MMDYAEVDEIWRKNNNPWADSRELELWVLARSMLGWMEDIPVGNRLNELEQLCKIERDRLLDCLVPEDQHKLKQIKKNVVEKADYSKEISLRSALSEAYGAIGFAMADFKKDYNQAKMKEAERKAVADVKLKIIDNPAFEEFS
jgi:hypothetical protein